MPDTTTASQWQQVVTDLTLEKTKLLFQIEKNKLQIAELENNGLSISSSTIIAINFENDRLEQEIERTNLEIVNAKQQAEIAADAPLGPPGTNPLAENTPPVRADTDPFEAARLEAVARSEQPQPSSQQVIDAINDDILRQWEQNQATAAAEDEAARNTASMAAAEFGQQNLSASVAAAQNSGRTFQAEIPKINDWRFRISLATNTNYLYNSHNPGILAPLKNTNGVIFPYTPTVSVTYLANYEPSDVAHSNYKVYNYRNSSVENISITGDFTAQDTKEANYLLAVIHFFRSATKMFYGQDVGPIRGIPPPLCYLNGHGDYAFNKHAVVISSFTLIYPPDVDYILARPNINTSNNTPSTTGDSRLANNRLGPGGLVKQPQWATNSTTELGTRIPTRMQIQLQCYPIVSRKNVSNNFSLEKYASGELLLGNKNISGGFW